MPWLSFPSPLGVLTLTEEEGYLVSLDWGQAPSGTSNSLLEKAQRQLDEYFEGQRTVFDLPYAPSGTVFQKKVWQALTKIDYGKTVSYNQLAKMVESGPRAVGTACGRNPLPILIPCHRILASNGGLGGYSAMDGINSKKFLLDLEASL